MVPAQDCADLKSRRPDAATGDYWLRLGDAPILARCDQETDDGGWTRCAGILPDLRPGFASERWGSQDEGASFGIDCQAAVTAGGGTADYRLSTEELATNTLHTVVTAADFDGAIEFEPGTERWDPLYRFWIAEYCGEAGDCGQFMNTDGQLEKGGVKAAMVGCVGLATDCSTARICSALPMILHRSFPAISRGFGAIFISVPVVLTTLIGPALVV